MTANLTPRQQLVIDGMARGLANKQIAAEIGVSEASVKAHVSDLLQKFAVPNRAGLIARVLADAHAPPALVISAEELARYQDVAFMVAVTEGPRHRFVFVNNMSAAVAGRPVASLVGLEMSAAYPQLDPMFRGALDEVYRSGTPWSVPRAPARFPHPDGSVRETWLNLLFAPMRDVKGRVVGLLHIGTEVEADEP